MFRVLAICQVNFCCLFKAVRHTLHVTVEVGIQIFRAVTLCCWVSDAHCLEGSRFLHLQGQEFFLVV